MSDPASRALDWTLRGRHGAPKALATLLCAAARGAGATPLPGADAERADAAHAWGASPWSPWWMAVVVALGWAAWWTVTQRQRRSQRRSEARLRESEERWKFALEGAGDGVWDANLALGTTLYSKRWKQILGYEEHEIGDAPAEWFGRIHPDDLPQFLAANRECVDGVRDGFVAEFRMRSKDGRWIWVLDRGKVLRRSANGKALRMIGTHTDISDRKATQARDAARAEIMTLIATGAALPVILQAIVRGVESRFDWLCSIMLVDGARGQLIIGAAPSLPAQFNQVVDGMRIGPDEGPCGAAVHHVRRQVAADRRDGLAIDCDIGRKHRDRYGAAPAGNRRREALPVAGLLERRPVLHPQCRDREERVHDGRRAGAERRKPLERRNEQESGKQRRGADDDQILCWDRRDAGGCEKHTEDR